MNTALQIKNYILAFLSAMGAAIISFLGGWDTAVQTLVIFIIIDVISGLVLALVFKKSDKTLGGAADSRICFKGLIRKVAMLVIVGVAALLDKFLGTMELCRTTVIMFFIGNEGLSICENIGLMGVPLPAFLIKALERLRKNSETIDKSDLDKTDKDSDTDD